MPSAQGGCLCGRIRYEVHAEPTNVAMCHCRFCQKATGTAYETCARGEDFGLTSGVVVACERWVL